MSDRGGEVSERKEEVQEWEVEEGKVEEEEQVVKKADICVWSDLTRMARGKNS